MFYTINFKRIIRAVAPLIIAVTFLALGGSVFNRLFPLKYIDIIKENSIEYGLSPAFVCAVIHAESKFNEKALSPKGASGLMQIMDPTAFWLAGQLGMDNFQGENVFTPEVNIKMGTFYLNKLIKQFDGNVEVALAAYNAGSGNVDNWLKDPKYSNDGITLKYIPYSQTREYIKKINRNIKIYKIILRLEEIFNIY